VVGSQALGYAMMLGIFGLIMPGIDNYAHAGGFIGGYLVAQGLDPLKPERIDHLVLALVCLVATFFALAASIVHGLALFLR
jgi:rhomboid protease GluP